MENFFDYYELYRSSDNIDEKYTNNPLGKTCRFCQQSYPSVPFETIPHIVPELFGRNNVTSNNECDICNKKFQKYENDTSTMIQHYLALLKIKTKKGVPIFQSQKSPDEYSTTLKLLNDNANINFGKNFSDYKFDNEAKTLTVKFRTRKFCPYSVYKTFLKIGISLLTDNEIHINKHFLDFLNSETPINNGMQEWTIYRYMLKTKFYSTPKIDLYRAKQTLIAKDEFPEYILIVNFANIIFQFFLPISQTNIANYKKENRLNFQLYPSFMYDDIAKLESIEMFNMTLNETQKISITDKVILHYKKRDTSKN